MRLYGIKYGLAFGLCLAITAGSAQFGLAQGVVSSDAGGDNAGAAQAALDYWTPERMAAAQPLDIPGVAMDDASIQAATQVVPQVVGPPGVAYGWPPGKAPAVQKIRIFDSAAAPELAAPQYFSSAPTDPLNGAYGPFSRQTLEGNYLAWPRSTLGKLFFSIGASGFVCSATVIGTSTIATAGHCVASGAGAFYTNFLFCPSYYNPTPTSGAPFPTRGCWGATTMATSTAWFSSGDPDSDYACIVTNTTGTVVSNKVGNVTGSVGRAWNWGTDLAITTTGYPHAAPFLGNTLQMTNGPIWYGWDATAGGQVSNVVGSDLTGGSSGGAWFLGWRAPSTEIVDTDSRWDTDPLGAGPYLYGVNSHKRCRTSCFTPPTATAGTFWQEMTSPPMSSSAAGGESEDIFAACLAHANNN